MNAPSGPKLCPSCGLLSLRNAERCDCGYNFATGAHGSEPPYGSLWRRFCAAILDNLVLGLAWVPMILVTVPDVPAPQPGDLPGWFMFVSLISWWLYYALQESSSHQATLGKRALGLVVTSVDGSRLSFGIATARCFAKVLSNMTFGIGYAMAAFTRRRQGLHDLVAGTIVMQKS